jgi:uncharacterized protein (TIGR00251 family)
VIITIYAKPNARENKIVWVDEDTVQIWITAGPEKGKANKELVDFLAKTWGIAKNDIQITRGLLAKIKQITIPESCREKIILHQKNSYLGCFLTSLYSGTGSRPPGENG